MFKTRQGNQQQHGRRAKRWEGEETCPRGGISVNFVGTTHKPPRLACVRGTSRTKQDHYLNPHPPPASPCLPAQSPLHALNRQTFRPHLPPPLRERPTPHAAAAHHHRTLST